MYPTQLHVSSHENRQQQKGHTMLLGVPTGRLQEAPLPVSAREAEGPVPGSGERIVAARK